MSCSVARQRAGPRLRLSLRGPTASPASIFLQQTLPPAVSWLKPPGCPPAQRLCEARPQTPSESLSNACAGFQARYWETRELSRVRHEWAAGCSGLRPVRRLRVSALRVPVSLLLFDRPLCQVSSGDFFFGKVFSEWRSHYALLWLA